VEIQSGHEEAQGEGEGGNVAVAFTEDEELVGAVEEVERMNGPFDVVGGMVGEEEAGGENDDEAESGVGEAPAREMLPEQKVSSGGEKPERAERMGEEHERD